APAADAPAAGVPFPSSGAPAGHDTSVRPGRRRGFSRRCSMNPLSKRFWCVLGLAALCLAVGCQRAPAPDGGPAVVQADAAAFEIAGPFAHENLSVFLLQAEQQDDRAYLTLDQGLRDGL